MVRGAAGSRRRGNGTRHRPTAWREAWCAGWGIARTPGPAAVEPVRQPSVRSAAHPAGEAGDLGAAGQRPTLARTRAQPPPVRPAALGRTGLIRPDDVPGGHRRPAPRKARTAARDRRRNRTVRGPGPGRSVEVTRLEGPRRPRAPRPPFHVKPSAAPRRKRAERVRRAAFTRRAPSSLVRTTPTDVTVARLACQGDARAASTVEGAWAAGHGRSVPTVGSGASSPETASGTRRQVGCGFHVKRRRTRWASRRARQCASDDVNRRPSRSPSRGVWATTRTQVGPEWARAPALRRVSEGPGAEGRSPWVSRPTLRWLRGASARPSCYQAAVRYICLRGSVGRGSRGRPAPCFTWNRMRGGSTAIGVPRGTAIPERPG